MNNMATISLDLPHPRPHQHFHQKLNWRRKNRCLYFQSLGYNSTQSQDNRCCNHINVLLFKSYSKFFLWVFQISSKYLNFSLIVLMTMECGYSFNPTFHRFSIDNNESQQIHFSFSFFIQQFSFHRLFLADKLFLLGHFS